MNLLNSAKIRKCGICLRTTITISTNSLIVRNKCSLNQRTLSKSFNVINLYGISDLCVYHSSASCAYIRKMLFQTDSIQSIYNLPNFLGLAFVSYCIISNAFLWLALHYTAPCLVYFTPMLNSVWKSNITIQVI